MRYISFTRSELVWQNYSVEWTEEEFRNWKEYLKQPNPSKWMEIYNHSIYAVVENMTWEQAIDEFEKWDIDSADESLTIVHFPSIYKIPDRPVGEFLNEAMDEDAWNACPEYGESVDTDRDVRIEGESDQEDE